MAVSTSVYNVYENYEICNKTTEMSTTKKIILSFIEDNYIKVSKNDETFLIEKNNPNLHFWIDIYSNWKSDTFTVFDNYLKKTRYSLTLVHAKLPSMVLENKNMYILLKLIHNCLPKCK